MDAHGKTEGLLKGLSIHPHDRLFTQRHWIADLKRRLSGSAAPDIGGRRQAWQKAGRSLRALGFHLAVNRSTPDEEIWAKAWAGRDPDSEAPWELYQEIAQKHSSIRERHHQIWTHPAGFVVDVNSYVGAKETIVNSLRLHHQIDLGLDPDSDSDKNRMRELVHGNFYSESFGHWIYHGDNDPINGSRTSLKGLLSACLEMGAPKPLEKWSNGYYHLSPEIFSDAPRYCPSVHGVHGQSEREVHRIFESRIERQLSEFGRHCPADLLAVFSQSNKSLLAKPSAPFADHWGANSHMASCMAYAGFKTTPQEFRPLFASYKQAANELHKNATLPSPLPPSLAGSFSWLHVCMAICETLRGPSFEALRRAVETLPMAEIEKSGATRADAKGRGLFETLIGTIESSVYWGHISKDDPNLRGLMDALLSRGLHQGPRGIASAILSCKNPEAAACAMDAMCRRAAAGDWNFCPSDLEAVQIMEAGSLLAEKLSSGNERSDAYSEAFGAFGSLLEARELRAGMLDAEKQIKKSSSHSL